MKKLAIKILFLSILLMSCISSKSIRAQDRVVIGEMQNGNPTITMDLNLIKHNLEFFLKSIEIDKNLSNFSIIKNGDNYGLLASDENRNFKCLVLLELDEAIFYESQAPCQGSLVVTCHTGCDTECQPMVFDCKGYCTPPCLDGECKRTVTLTPDPVLPNKYKK